MMSDYTLITVIKGSLGNAGPKAPRDICSLLERTGRVDVVSLFTEDGLDFPTFLKLIPILKEIKETDQNVILQYPLQPYSYHEMQECYSQAFDFLEPDKTIIWMHDINQIRFRDEPVYKNEMNWLGRFHDFIVHNEKMEQYLRKYISIKYCIHNELFDYLCNENSMDRITKKAVHKRKEVQKEDLHIIFAGNLDSIKAPFLYDLQSNQMNFYMNVYGRRVELIKNVKINYCGSFDADILPERICGDLGLIWDGKIDAKSDYSAHKEYTRYNTPHKFSCYITAGIPVIAWREAAIAEIVKKYQVGYLIIL